MKVALCILSIALCACTHVPPQFRAGDQVIAQNWANAKYNGAVVSVTGELDWRWIKGQMFQGNALRVYEVTTVDGEKFAAQPFQLKRMETQ